jgi:hypothetical protein
VEVQAKQPLKDAAAVNATRFKLVEALGVFGLPLDTWTGGRTRWNRARFGVEKTHANDALCVGKLAGVKMGRLKVLRITATGRGTHCRTLWTKHGFPRAYLMRQKMVAGFATGDRIKACMPAPYKAEGTHVGRVAVRKTGAFVVQTTTGKVDNIYARFCTLVQRADGYDYAICPDDQGNGSAPLLPSIKKERLLPPLAEAQGYPQAEES